VIATINQPTYLPWLGLFDLIDQADVFVFLDDVQLTKRDWGVRNRIRTPQGELMLSVPVRKTAHRDALTYQAAELDDSTPWRRKHLQSIRMAYAKAPHASDVLPELEALLTAPHTHLADLNVATVTALARRLGITADIRRASALPGITGDKDARLLSICRQIGATVYVSSPGSAVYINRERPGGEFADSGVALRYRQYEHPTYPQLPFKGQPAFTPYMSVVDALCHMGWADTLALIRSGRRPSLAYTDYTPPPESADTEPSGD